MIRRIDIRYIILVIAFLTVVSLCVHSALRIGRCVFAETDVAWARCIRLIGPDAAFAYFKKTNSRVQFPESHERAHQFGRALFHEYGVAGVKYCDKMYEGGCIHGVVATSIIEKGVQVASASSQECSTFEQSSLHKNCYHSLGHGFVVLNGLEEPELLKSLKLCDTSIRDLSEIETHRQDCYEGVFMEYNQRNLTPGMSVREIDQHDIYGPCPRLDEKYKSGCYFRLTRLWGIKAASTSDEDFVGRAKRCDHIPDPNYRSRCISGLSTSMGYSGVRDNEQRQHLCDVMFQDKDERLNCREVTVEGP